MTGGDDIGVPNNDPEKKPAAAEVANAEFVGYIHNISPIKKERYFDFQLQGKHKTVCGVCFSPQKQKNFSKFSNASSPTKIKEFHVNTNSNAEDLLMGSDVSVEPFPSIDFPIVEKPTTINLSTIKSWSIVSWSNSYCCCKGYTCASFQLQVQVWQDPSSSLRLSLQKFLLFQYWQVQLRIDKLSVLTK